MANIPFPSAGLPIVDVYLQSGNNLADLASPATACANLGAGAVTNVLKSSYAGGADPTGTSDSTAAIQAAINAGGITYLPAGTYKITSALTGGNGVTLVGAGPLATTLSQTSTTANGLTLSTGSGALSNPAVSNLCLSGPGSGSGIGVSLAANSGASPVVGASLQNLVIKGFGGDALSGNVLITSVVSNVQAQNCGAGFHLFGGGTSVSMVSCYANGCAARGFYLAGQFYTSLQGCAADSCGLGYEISGGTGVALTGCGAEAITAAGGVDGTQFKVNGGIGHSLMSCYSSVNKAVAFWVTGSATQISLIGCQETAPGGGATASVKTDPATLSNLFGISTVTARALTVNTYELFADVSGQWTLAGTGNIGALNCYGPLDVAQAGNGLQIAEGSNCKQGTAVLNSTTPVAVANTSVTANSRIFLTTQSPVGATLGTPYVSARSAGVSFTIKSTGTADTSTVAYLITEPG